MTKREAAIIGAFTGILIGDFSDMHGYIEEIMGRAVFTHEMGNKEIAQEIKNKSKTDLLNICSNITED